MMTRTKTRKNWQVRGLVALLLAFAISVGALPSSVGAAFAATGDYTVAIDSPATVPHRDAFTYGVTLEVEATPVDPAVGIVLTTVLSPGQTFQGASTDASSPIASYTWDAATRTIVFTMKPLTEQLVAFNFNVTQTSQDTNTESTVFTADVTGSTTPSGTVPADSSSTQVVGNNDYLTGKALTVVAGTGNRVVNYTFDVGVSSIPLTFTSYTQRLTDVFPAGAVIVGSSPGWVFTTNPDGTTTAVRETTGAYASVGGSNFGGYITVEYPVSAFPDGTLPPLNTVDLDTTDFDGTWHDQPPATAQGPVLSSDTGGPSISVIKGREPGLDRDGWRNGVDVGLLYGYNTVATYTNPDPSVGLESFTLEDTSTFSSGNFDHFDHIDIHNMRIEFPGALGAANLPYTIEYTTSGSPTTWQTFTPPSPTTGTTASFTVYPAGSTGYGSPTLFTPVGEHMTGWRIVVSPDAATTVPNYSEIRVRTGVRPSFLGASDGLPSAEFVNTATSTGTTSDGVQLAGEDPYQFFVVDEQNLTTSVNAPTTVTVGQPATYEACAANTDPSKRTYLDTEMTVVLPVGVFYDTTVGATPTSATTLFGGHPVPQVGDGVTVSTTTVTDALGEHQVVVFRFDELPSFYGAGVPTHTNWNQVAYCYNIPTIVTPQAYTPDGSTAAATSYIHTEDPAFASIPKPSASADVFDFDPAQATIVSHTDSSAVLNAGGLLIGKLVRETAADRFLPTAEVASPGVAEWQIYVANVLPRPVTDIVLFDRMPFVGDANGSEFPVTMSGPIAGAPAGSTVEYSVDATVATDGTWTTDPTNATAWRITVPSLATNENFTLTFPTAVPDGALYEQLSTNVATATGTYDGEPREFYSNVASVTPAPTPALALVKATNGVVYDAAPGAIVGVGSDVTWTYTVTNTGNTLLDPVTVSDTFAAGDGSTGTFTATSVDTGPLAPGATRVFTATGTAIEGQYMNTATATATAVDEAGTALPVQPASVTDDSWYLAGDAGLTVVKLTNGEDVTSAPGPQLVPGDAVEWSYAVTNTGTLDLVDVLVEDVDFEGNIVFSEVVPSLAPGESITLTATGTVIEGQYENNVTASADDPSGGSSRLIAADSSWYFGVRSDTTPTLPVTGGEVPGWLVLIAAMMLLIGGVVFRLARREHTFK